MSDSHDQPSTSPSAEPEWLDDDLELEEGDPELEMEPLLPLSAENWVTGEPLVTVDYFSLAAVHRIDAAVQKLLALDGARPDRGAQCPRVLLLEGADPHGPLETHRIVAIFTVRDLALRVETARAGLADPVRALVERALGADARHRLRRKENPIADVLGPDA